VKSDADKQVVAYFPPPREGLSWGGSPCLGTVLGGRELWQGLGESPGFLHWRLGSPFGDV
jgi:hypothetical protein